MVSSGTELAKMSVQYITFQYKVMKPKTTLLHLAHFELLPPPFVFLVKQHRPGWGNGKARMRKATRTCVICPQVAAIMPSNEMVSGAYFFKVLTNRLKQLNLKVINILIQDHRNNNEIN
jgi:hypothetical protein